MRWRSVALGHSGRALTMKQKRMAKPQQTVRSATELLEKIPSLDNDALANLKDNAERLEKAGTPSQQSAAALLLPAIKTEQGARRAIKLAQIKETKKTALGEIEQGKT